MKVSQVMVTEVVTCRAGDTLEAAAATMWDRDIGCLPVLDDERGRLVGILTDRDICMSAYARKEPLAALPVTLAMAPVVIACGPDDVVDDVLRVMAERRIRRMPVVDDEERVIGLVSVDDVAAAAMRTAAVWSGEVVATLAAIAHSRVAGRAAGADPAR